MKKLFIALLALNLCPDLKCSDFKTPDTDTSNPLLPVPGGFTRRPTNIDNDAFAASAVSHWLQQIEVASQIEDGAKDPAALADMINYLTTIGNALPRRCSMLPGLAAKIKRGQEIIAKLSERLQ